MTISHWTKFILSLILGLFIQAQGFCIELDTSIDDEINRNYNATELEHTLPKLPQNIEPNTPTYKKQSGTQPGKTISKRPQQDDFTAIKIRRGTKFRAISQTWASDSTLEGNRITFTTTKPVTRRYITIPAGSTIHGRFVDTHSPQYTGNGGLIKIDVESIVIQGATHHVDGKITKANGKKIFFNNIKGKRKYLAGIGKDIKRSHKFFQKSMKKTSQYANDSLTVILCPFTFIGGTIGWLGGTVLSPITALNTKGERISLPPNTLYQIKLTQDLYIY